MYWKETGDISVWKGIAQDALIMNVDDLILRRGFGSYVFGNPQPSEGTNISFLER